MSGWFLFNCPTSVDPNKVGYYSVGDQECFSIQDDFTNIHHTNDPNEVLRWVKKAPFVEVKK